jgi:hypothetical protein
MSRKYYRMKVLLFTLIFHAITVGALAQNLTLFEQEGKYGYQNEEGKIIIEPIYQEGKEFSEGLAPIKLSDRWGYIDTSGKVVLPFIYLGADQFYIGIASVETEKGEQAISQTGELFDRELEIVSEKLVLRSFTEIIDPKKKTYKLGLIDGHGKHILPALFDDIFEENGQIIVQIEERTATVDLNSGKIEHTLYEFKNSKNKYGFQDFFGKLIIKPKYDQIIEIWPTVGIVNLKGRQALIRFKDKSEYSFDQIDVPIFDNIPSKLIVTLNGKKGMIDKTGKLLIPILFDDLIESYFDRYQLYGVVVNQNDKLGIIDRTGKQLTSIRYDQISFDFDGHEVCKYAKVQQNDKWGCVDNKTGKELIAAKYDRIQFAALYGESNFDTTDIAQINYCLVNSGIKIDTLFSYEEYVKRNKDDSWDIIEQSNTNESVVRYIIRGGGKWGLVDFSGKELTPIKYDKMRIYFKDGMLPVKLENKWGFINKLGQEVIPFVYEKVDYFYDGKAQVEMDGRSFYIDKNGMEVK